MKLLVFSLGLAALVLLCIRKLPLPSEAPPQPRRPTKADVAPIRSPSVIEDPIVTVFESFARNPVAALEKYKGNLLTVVGRVQVVTADGVLLVDETLGPARILTYGVLFKDKSQYGRLEIGRRVTTSGRVKGGTYTSALGDEVFITLEECVDPK